MKMYITSRIWFVLLSGGCSAKMKGRGRQALYMRAIPNVALKTGSKHDYILI
jgi:hypothetical protein